MVEVKYSIESTEEYTYLFYSREKDLYLHSYDEEEEIKYLGIKGITMRS